jgi:hypothetical protein
VTVGKTALEDDVLSFNPPRFFQGLGKRVEKAARFGRLRACDKKKTKAAACRCGLLRLYRGSSRVQRSISETTLLPDDFAFQPRP